MVADYRRSKDNFIFHNENPKGLLSAADCVIRAISKGIGKSWEQVLEDLLQIALKVKDTPTSDRVYGKYLEDLGYPKQKQPRKKDNTKYTTDEFAKKFNKGIFIISLANHLSVVIDGKIYDTWNCSNKSVGNYWEVEDNVQSIRGA